MKYKELWQERFELAKEYYEKNGNLFIPNDYVVYKDGEEVKLGWWITVQRNFYNNGKLSEYKIKSLESIGMHWRSFNDERWLLVYKEVLKYYKENGNINVPKGYSVIVNGRKNDLSVWLKHQKTNLNNDVLSDEQKKLFLALLELSSTKVISYDQKWLSKYELAKEYYEKNGNLLIPQDYVVYNKDGEKVKLGMWINTQRNAYNNGSLSEYRIKSLESIGMNWGSFNDERWLLVYKEVLKYYKENGNINIPKGYSVIINGRKNDLSVWLILQNRNLNSGELSDERKELFLNLLEMGKDTKSTLHNQKWLSTYELAKEYYEKNGDLLITSDYVVYKNGEKINLGRWINTQRKSYKSSKLSKERILLLEDIKMVWKFHNKYPLEEKLKNDVENKNLVKWTRMYDLAKEYYHKNGNLLIPHFYEVNSGGKTIKLGSWLHNQRNFYKKGKLPLDRTLLLEDIGMKWSDVKRSVLDRKWLIMYKEALKYYNENGNLVIPNDYVVTINGIDYLLKVWIGKQKIYLNSGKLSEDKKELFVKLMNLSDITCVYDLKFMKYYSLCKEYYEENGNLLIPADYVVYKNGEKINLGFWINSQRMSYKGKRAELSDERIKMLDELGMIWEFSSIKEKEWIRKYKLLKTYYDTNGDLYIPHNYTVDGANLDSWLLHQKYLYNNGKLSKEKADMLQEIGVYFGRSRSLKRK